MRAPVQQQRCALRPAYIRSYNQTLVLLLLGHARRCLSAVVQHAHASVPCISHSDSGTRQVPVACITP
jgi:hypothetical protein